MTLQRYDSDIAVYESGRKIFKKKLRGTFGNCSTALQRYSVTVLERLFSTPKKLLYLINIEYIFDPFDMGLGTVTL